MGVAVSVAGAGENDISFLCVSDTSKERVWLKGRVPVRKEQVTVAWRMSPKYSVITFEGHIKVLVSGAGAATRGVTVDGTPCMLLSCLPRGSQQSLFSRGKVLGSSAQGPGAAEVCEELERKPAVLTGAQGTPR